MGMRRMIIFYIKAFFTSLWNIKQLQERIDTNIQFPAYVCNVEGVRVRVGTLIYLSAENAHREACAQDFARATPRSSLLGVTFIQGAKLLPQLHLGMPRGKDSGQGSVGRAKYLLGPPVCAVQGSWCHRSLSASVPTGALRKNPVSFVTRKI